MDNWIQEVAKSDSTPFHYSKINLVHRTITYSGKY